MKLRTLVRLNIMSVTNSRCFSDEQLLNDKEHVTTHEELVNGVINSHSQLVPLNVNM